MFKTEVKKGQVLGPEFMPHYWNPNRIGARKAPAWFMEKVDRDFADIEIVWNPINQRWQVFSKAPKMQHPLVSGWRLLFVHNGANGEHLPLDERLLAVGKSLARISENERDRLPLRLEARIELLEPCDDRAV